MTMRYDLTPGEVVGMLKLIDQNDGKLSPEHARLCASVRKKFTTPPPIDDTRAELRDALAMLMDAAAWFRKMLEMDTMPTTHRYASGVIEVNSAYHRVREVMAKFEEACKR